MTGEWACWVYQAMMSNGYIRFILSSLNVASLSQMQRRKSRDTVESDWISMLTVNAREVYFHEFRVVSLRTYFILECTPDIEFYF